jgi:Divergent InlB B-repeat domain
LNYFRKEESLILLGALNDRKGVMPVKLWQHPSLEAIMKPWKVLTAAGMVLCLLICSLFITSATLAEEIRASEPAPDPAKAGSASSVPGSPPSGQTTTVNPPSDTVPEKSPSGCTYSISPASQAFSSSGSAGNIVVSTQNSCQWTASSSATWVTIDSTNKGSGNGTITFSLSSNLGGGTRTSRISVEGETFLIVQRGAPETAVEYPLTVRKTGSGQGTVTVNPTGTSFSKGTSVTLYAVANADSVFSGWSGACSGKAQACSIKINSATSLTASFLLRTFTISVSPPSNGIIYPPGPVKAAYREKRTFQIIPLPGYHVSDVLVDRASVGMVNSYTFKDIVADHVIQATFVKQ